MQFHNFEYDGVRLNDMGYTVCSFDSGGLQTTSNGSRIEFHTVPSSKGTRHDLTDTSYDECLSATIQICKIPLQNKRQSINTHELRELMNWLNRKEFHKFRLLEEDYPNIYLEASFNVSKIEIEGTVYGLELEMITNRPFAIHEPVEITLNYTKPNEKKAVYPYSDEEGFLYPHTEIEVAADGDFTLKNDSDHQALFIAGCRAGELITLDYPIIASSLPSHKIQNDFNWHFFRMANTFHNKKNTLSASLPCRITLTYSPVIKIQI